VRLRIARSAHNHAVPDLDIRHAINNVMFSYPPDGERLTMVVPSRSARFLEIGYVQSEDGVLIVVHAMPARRKYLR
jgi:hypothetical protein